MRLLLPPTFLARVKNPSLNLLRTFMSSPSCRSALAPTFSSTGNTAKIVSRLGPDRIFTMIMTGKPNKPIHLDLDEFLPGAVSAAGVVSSCMSSGDWEGLEGLVDRDCITGLQASMDTMDKVQKDLVVVNPDDVFLSFVSNPDQCDSGNNLHLVTFSLPKLEQARNMVKENKELLRQTEQNIKDSEGDVQQKVAMMDEYKAKFSSNDPHDLLKENEILIGNFRFVRASPSSQWTIMEVAQINSVQAWATIFKLRWKGRLNIATRGGYEFYTILRIDYTTDYFAFFTITGFYVIQLLGAGVISAPHL